jgi:hypothetical protein
MTGETGTHRPGLIDRTKREHVDAAMAVIDMLPFEQQWPLLRLMCWLDPSLLPDERVLAWIKANAHKMRAVVEAGRLWEIEP